LRVSHCIGGRVPGKAVNWFRFAGVMVAGAFLTAGVASAEFVAYTGQPNPQSVPPLQAYGGSLGMDFTVNSAINVDSMGVYNAAGNGVITGTLQVAIFEQNPDSTWSEVTGTYASFNNASPGSPDLVNDGKYDLYKAIAPVLLDPGTYSIVAVGFSQQDPDGNTGYTDGVGAAETGGSLLTYTGSARFDAAQTGTLIFPTTVDGGPANRYDAGTFEFSAATPEPASFILIGTGLALVAVVRLRRRTSALNDGVI
jgi:hypothetical protein